MYRDSTRALLTRQASDALLGSFRIKRDSWSNERALCLASKANSRHRFVSPATSGMYGSLGRFSQMHTLRHVICLDLMGSSLALTYGFAYVSSRRPRTKQILSSTYFASSAGPFDQFVANFSPKLPSNISTLNIFVTNPQEWSFKVKSFLEIKRRIKVFVIYFYPEGCFAKFPRSPLL